MQNGAVGNLCGSSIMRGFPQAEERIWGSNGSMVLSGSGIQVFSTRPVDGKRPGSVNSYTKFPETSWTADWVSAFVNAVRTGGEPPVGPREGWENLAFITSAYQSMERGAAQRVPVFAERLEVARVLNVPRRLSSFASPVARVTTTASTSDQPFVVGHSPTSGLVLAAVDAEHASVRADIRVDVRAGRGFARCRAGARPAGAGGRVVDVGIAAPGTGRGRGLHLGRRAFGARGTGGALARRMSGRRARSRPALEPRRTSRALTGPTPRKPRAS